MTTKLCPFCKKERPARGFHFHTKACSKKHDPLRARYALQIENMSPAHAERFLRKARETIGAPICQQ